MNKILMAIMLVGSSFGGVQLKGQEVNPLVPPLIWTATFQYKKERVRPTDPKEAKIFDRVQLLAGQCKLRTVYLTKNSRREIVDWVGNRRTERWIAKGYALYTALNFPPGKVSYYLVEEDIELPTADPAKTYQNSEFNFPELNWIRPECLAGTVSYNGAQALHYVDPPAGSPPNERKSKSEAWISVKTGFPIAMEDDEKRVDYSVKIQPPTDADMTMPTEFQKVWQSMLKAGIVE